MLSICIPSYNRANYLLKALNSIYSQNNHSMNFEVCISNNCSSDDYSKVEDYIDEINQYNIRYIIQESPLSIDDNMHYVTKMARGDYIYIFLAMMTISIQMHLINWKNCCSKMMLIWQRSMQLLLMQAII